MNVNIQLKHERLNPADNVLNIMAYYRNMYVYFTTHNQVWVWGFFTMFYLLYGTKLFGLNRLFNLFLIGMLYF